MSESNGTEEVVDGTATEIVTENGHHEPSTIERRTPASLTVTPEVEASELVKRMEVISSAMHDAMKKDVDYGEIPGTNSKPSLLKPGAEKLGVLFQLDIQLVNEKTWGPGDHLTVVSKATVFHAPTGARLGFGEGICTTREKKYGKRRAQRECPNCGKENIRVSNDGSGSFYCWRKTDGCGQNFPANDERITGQVEGEIENPDLPDTWNTVVKMAEKRARVDAVLAVTGASALFTQDVEDNVAPEPSPEPQQQARPAQQQRPQQAQPSQADQQAAEAKAQQELNALLAEDSPLKEKRAEADKRMKLLDGTAVGRLTALRRDNDEEKLDELLARLDRMADEALAKEQS